MNDIFALVFGTRFTLCLFDAFLCLDLSISLFLGNFVVD